jgi:hypothetical protein
MPPSADATCLFLKLCPLLVRHLVVAHFTDFPALQPLLEVCFEKATRCGQRAQITAEDVRETESFLIPQLTL